MNLFDYSFEWESSYLVSKNETVKPITKRTPPITTSETGSALASAQLTYRAYISVFINIDAIEPKESPVTAKNAVCL